MAASKSPVEINPEHKDIHTAMGRAIEAHAKVERSQTWLLSAILNIDRSKASAIFHSVQNVRRCNAMVQALLSFTYEDRYREFWKGCAKFLENLVFHT
jgi:hypothetical protein